MVTYTYSLLIAALTILSSSAIIQSMTTHHSDLALIVDEKIKIQEQLDPALEPITIPAHLRGGGAKTIVAALCSAALNGVGHILCSNSIIAALQDECQKHQAFFDQQGITQPAEQIFINQHPPTFFEVVACDCEAFHNDKLFCHCMPQTHYPWAAYTADKEFYTTPIHAGFYTTPNDPAITKPLYLSKAQEYLKSHLIKNSLETDYKIYDTDNGIAYFKKNNAAEIFNTEQFTHRNSVTELPKTRSHSWIQALQSWCKPSAEDGPQTILFSGHGNDKVLCTLPHSYSNTLITSLKKAFPSLNTLGVTSCYNDAQRVKTILNTVEFDCIISKLTGSNYCVRDGSCIRLYNPTTKALQLGSINSPDDEADNYNECMFFDDLVSRIHQQRVANAINKTACDVESIKKMVAQYKTHQPDNNPSVLIGNKAFDTL